MAISFLFGRNKGRRGSAVVRGGLSVAAIGAVLGAVVWMSYPEEGAPNRAAVPLIRADAGPYKVMPKEPGGMTIPHRDSTVFETYRSADAGHSGAVESLLPEPEEPVDRQELFAGLKTEFDGAAAGGDRTGTGGPKDVANNSNVIPPENQAASAAMIEPAPQPAVKPSVADTAVAVSQTASPADETANEIAATEPAAGHAPTDIKGGGHRVQLGSFRSSADAEKGWQALQKKFPQELEELSLHVQKADLGARGIYYRVQAGPVPEKQARAICQAVSEKQPGGCLVVSP